MIRPQGSYGIDAPYVPISFLLTAAIAVVLGFLTTGAAWGWWIVAAFFLALGLIYLRTSRRGKFTIWRDLVTDAGLQGDERAVDLGCGRGAVTVILAEHLPRGHVDGIDLWRSQDQSGNDEAHTRANLEANRVGSRVDLHTANMLDLPFSQSSVDLVTASFSIHNLKAAADRKKAVAEAYRILKPGGRVIVADISKVKEYEQALVALGAKDIQVRRAGFDGWWSAPWMPTTTLIATKA